MTAAIEIIARAVITAERHLLLARKKGAAHTFLPGGHVEFGEPAEVALARELQEELGIVAEIGRFLGAIEHAWDDAHGRSHELNLVFEVTWPGLDKPAPVRSAEPHLEFVWQPTDRLAAVNLLPTVLCDVLPRWLDARAGSGWSSTLR
ncbi:MAG: NUDIX domain-containing protein [bacterium]|nr:NUDIX domain-containing protein [bacterium]